MGREKEPASEHFKFSEFKCKDGTDVPEKYWGNLISLLNLLEKIRQDCNEPVYIVSGYRTPKYNSKCGGVRKSQHLLAKAADIRVRKMKVLTLYKICCKLNPNGGVGLYLDHGFIHVDVRETKARWKG